MPIYTIQITDASGLSYGPIFGIANGMSQAMEMIKAAVERDGGEWQCDGPLAKCDCSYEGWKVVKQWDYVFTYLDSNGTPAYACLTSWPALKSN